MKKYICSILSVLMLFTYFGVVSAQNTAEEKFSQEIKILSDLGVIQEKYVSESKISRAEFVSAIVNVLDYNNSIIREYENSPFNDVTKEDEYYNKICRAYEYGLISGKGDSLFHPSDGVAYNEAIKMLIHALGYDEVAKHYGGFPDGYLKMGNDLNIGKGVNCVATYITKGEAAKLLFNTLEAPVAARTFSGKSGISLTKANETLMWHAMNVNRIDGVLSRNSYTSLITTSDASLNTICIGKLEGSFYHSTDEEKYLGYNVRSYYKVTEDDEIVYKSIIPLNNNVITINEDEFIDFSDGVLYYEQGKTGRVKNSRILPSTPVIYNQNAKLDYVKEDFEIVDGTINLIDNNGDSEIDVVSIEEYKNYVISNNDTIQETIYDFNGLTLNYENDDEERRILFVDSNGESVSPETFQKEQILTAVVSADGKYIRGIIVNKSITGKISSLDLSDERIIKIDSEQYTISKSVPNSTLAKLKLGIEATVLFDAFDNVAYISYESALTDYAMFIKHYEDTLEDVITIKLMDYSGVIRKYPVYKKARINGTRIQDASAISSALSRNDVFLYKLNTSNEITSIETKDGNVLRSLGARATLTYNSNTRSFGTFSLPSDEKSTAVFYYPDPQDGDASDDGYFVLDANYVRGGSAEIEGYTTAEDSFVPECLAIKDGNYLLENRIGWNDGKYIFIRLIHGLNVYDEITYFIEVCSFDGKISKLELKNEAVYDSLIAKAKDLTCGDMITFSRVNNGVIDKIDKFFDYETFTIPTSSKFYSGAGFRPKAKYIYEITPSFIGFSESKNKAESISEVEYHNIIESAYVIKIDGRNISSNKVNTTSLRDYVNNKAPQKVFYYTRDGIIQNIVVFEEE